MGIYLGQLPPAEIARLKAELAETLIANFCYPRFYDYRTDSLQMRPVDRVKRQEVWLYLSSVDFTAWNRVDLMSPDFQHYIERLFIQFVQRNRSFFGNQGRRRMPDIRSLISSCAASVSLGLRNHVSGQKQNGPSFGSPRPVLSWSTMNISGHPEPGWEQVADATLILQQQLQEVRGEAKTPFTTVGEPRNGSQVSTSTTSANGSTRRPTRPQAPVRPVVPAQAAESNGSAGQQPTAPTTPIHLPPPIRSSSGAANASGQRCICFTYTCPFEDRDLAHAKWKCTFCGTFVCRGSSRPCAGKQEGCARDARWRQWDVSSGR